MMSKRSYTKPTYCSFLYVILATLCVFATTDARAVVIDKSKFFKLTREQNDALVLKVASSSPFKNLSNYKSNARRLNRHPKMMRGFTADRDFRRMKSKLVPSDTLTWPIPANAEQRISSPFGYRKHPITGKRAFHAGIDIAVAKGTPVKATHNGIVTEVSRHKNLGRFVKVKHSDEEYSLYGHLSKWKVREGDRVYAGDIVGKVGSTGRSTGPHLDYSLRRKGKAVNPMHYLTPPKSIKGTRLSSLQ